MSDVEQLEFAYMEESEKTLSPHFYPERVPPIEFDMVLMAAKAIADRADRLKKVLFYGKEAKFGAAFGSASSVSLDPSRANFIHAVLGIFTEAGELMENLYDVLSGRSALDITNIVEELGDLEWYMAILHREFGLTPSQVKRRNIEKLKARYPNRFEEEKALNRDLDNERKVLES